MTLIEFYKRVLNNIGMTTSDDGFIYIGENENKHLVLSNGKPLVIPTKDHINTIYSNDENGDVIVSKIPFNPLNEDVVKGDSESFKKLTHGISYRLSHVFMAVGELLLILGNNKNLQNNTNTEINKFMQAILKANNKGIKQIIDDTTINNWTNLYRNFIKTNGSVFKLFIKKKGTYMDKTYIRLGVLSSELYDSLLKLEKEATLFNVKLRTKDIIVFKELFKFIIEDFTDENNTTCFGSSDNESPAFIASFGLYIKIYNRFNYLLSKLKHVDIETYDLYYLKDLLTIDEVNNVSSFKRELLSIPSENDLNRSIHTKQPTIGSVSSMDPYPKEPVSLNNNVQEVNNDPLLRALSKNPSSGVTVMPNIPMQQPDVNMGMMNFGVPNVNTGLYGMNQMPNTMMPYMVPNMTQPNMGIPNMGIPNTNMNIPNIGVPNSYYIR